jgi:hypothetical protein
MSNSAQNWMLAAADWLDAFAEQKASVALSEEQRKPVIEKQTKLAMVLGVCSEALTDEERARVLATLRAVAANPGFR